MASMSHDPGLRVNPVVHELLSAGEGQVAAFAGFVGSIAEGRVRVYSDLGLARYVELPEAAVVRVLDPPAPEQPSVVLVRRAAEITYVQTMSSAGISVRQTVTATIDALQALPAGVGTTPHDRGCCAGGEASAARQSGGGPVVDLCTWGCQERLALCVAGSGPLGAVWCYLSYGLCRVGCIDPPVIAV